MLCKLKGTIFLSAWKRCKNRRYCTVLLFFCFSVDFKVFHLLLLLFHLMVCLLLFSKAQSEKQNRALEEQLNDHKYQVRKETRLTA